jgi:hypothetical protein
VSRDHEPADFTGQKQSGATVHPPTSLQISGILNFSVQARSYF